MPKQTLTTKILQETVKMASELEYGELGEILDIEIEKYNGVIITRMFEGFVVVKGNESCLAFETSWTDSFDQKVRVLDRDEGVLLTND